MCSKKFIIGLLFFMMFMQIALAEFDPFASVVVNISLNGPVEPYYLPAPGQWVNNPYFNKAYRALGPLEGGGLENQNNDDIVSLGGFGGKIVLAFEQDVQNNPANPFGMDAIVYSNAIWYNSDPNFHSGELATIEIMPELNDNNTPGDDPCERWFLIPGSHLSDSSTYRSQYWDKFDPTLVGYPNFTNWPTSYSTTAFELFPVYQNVGSEYEQRWVLVNPNRDDSNPNNDHLEGYWGYAEYTPAMKLGDRNADDIANGYGDCPNMPPELFYTVPDDPFTVGMTPGAGGGDAFDISWAVAPCTFAPANLSSFRYIRITTAVHEREFGDEGVLGEISAEIDAVADVRPYGDINGDDKVDLSDLDLFSQTWLSQWSGPFFNPAADFVVDNKIDLKDYAKFAYGFMQDAFVED